MDKFRNNALDIFVPESQTRDTKLPVGIKTIQLFNNKHIVMGQGDLTHRDAPIVTRLVMEPKV